MPADPLIPADVALIVAVPTLTAVTTPELETVATPVLLDDQDMLTPDMPLPF